MKAASHTGSCLRALFTPFFTRAAMTALVVTPALWAGTGEQIVGVALPGEANETIVDGTSFVHGAISGVIPKDEGSRDWLPREKAGYRSSPLDQEFLDLAFGSRSGSGGMSLGAAFRQYFISLGSFSAGATPAGFNENDGGGLGRFSGMLGAGLSSETNWSASERPRWTSYGSSLVPINVSNVSYDGNSSGGSGYSAGTWTRPVLSPAGDTIAGAPGPQDWYGIAPASLPGGGSNGAWNGSSGSGSIASTGTPGAPPPPLWNTFVSSTVPVSGGNFAASVSFRGGSSNSTVALAAATPAPQVATSLVLAAAPASAGTSGGTVATPAVSGNTNINYSFVTIGNPGNLGNAAYTSNPTIGAVPYVYAIGTYDVTLTQYTAFLNAVAKADPYGLYNSELASSSNVPAGDALVNGISQSVTSGGFTYAVIGDGSRPVTYVSWFDAARLANWMQNGQPTYSSGTGEVAGSTETGAYTLNGAVSGIITKNSNAVYWIPTESEWYKAAYYDPNYGGTGVGGYWTYATKSNSQPGNVPGSANGANYDDGGTYSVSQSSSTPTSNVLTEVGDFSSSPSAYGTYDQNGDVFNWNDAVIGSNRGIRGGAWSSFFTSLFDTASDNGLAPTEANSSVGIRLAMLVVPEPTVAVSLIFAGGLLLLRRKRPSTL